MVAYGPHGRISDSWWGSAVPATGPVGTASTYVGLRLSFTAPGRVMGFRAYRDANSSNSGQVLFWDTAGIMLGAVMLKDVLITPSARWQNVWVRPSIRISTSADYHLGVMFQGAHYYRRNTYLSGGPVAVGHITVENGWQSTTADVTHATPSYNTNANAVDVLFQPD